MLAGMHCGSLQDLEVRLHLLSMLQVNLNNSSIILNFINMSLLLLEPVLITPFENLRVLFQMQITYSQQF